MILQVFKVLFELQLILSDFLKNSILPEFYFLSTIDHPSGLLDWSWEGIGSRSHDNVRRWLLREKI